MMYQFGPSANVNSTATAAAIPNRKAADPIHDRKREHGADEQGEAVPHRFAGAGVAEEQVQHAADPAIERLVPERRLAALEPEAFHEDPVRETLVGQRVVAEQKEREPPDAPHREGGDQRQPRHADEKPGATGVPKSLRHRDEQTVRRAAARRREPRSTRPPATRSSPSRRRAKPSRPASRPPASTCSAPPTTTIRATRQSARASPSGRCVARPLRRESSARSRSPRRKTDPPRSTTARTASSGPSGSAARLTSWGPDPTSSTVSCPLTGAIGPAIDVAAHRHVGPDQKAERARCRRIHGPADLKRVLTIGRPRILFRQANEPASAEVAIVAIRQVDGPRREMRRPGVPARDDGGTLGGSASQYVRASQLRASDQPPVCGGFLTRNCPHHPACGTSSQVETFQASSSTTSVRAAGAFRNAG